MRYLILLMLLSGCSTPMYTMQKGEQIVTCGGDATGSMAGGIIGYHVQKGADEDCVNNYKDFGFEVVRVKE